MSNNNSFDYGTLFDEDNDPVVDVDVDELDELVDIESITTQDDDGYTLPLHVISEQEEKSVNQLIHGSYRVDSALARDVAYLADIDLDYVLSSHNITREELMEKLKQTHFKKLVRKFQDEIGEDGSGMLKVRANAYLDGGIGRLNEIIMDRSAKDENVIKAMTLLSQLSGAMPKTAGDMGSGVKIEFNFGNDNPMIHAKTIILDDS